MRKARVGLLVAAALVAVPLSAAAQPKGAAKQDKSAQKADPKGGGDAPKEVNLDEPAAGADQPATPVEGGDQPPEGEQQGGGICDITPEVCQNQDFDKLAKRPLNVEMYAVQQIYALRYHRFEVNAYGLQTLNDQFVGHPGGGLGVNWYISNVLAVGVNGNVYGNAVSSFNFQTSRSARVGLPITEYQWNANVNFSYVPAYGKFAGFGDFIFHYDFYVVGGVGAISTRPIAVVDPDNRVFSFEPKVDFRLGGGIRIFFNRWLAAVLEVSDYIFFDKLENPQIPTNIVDAQNKDTWLADGTSFTNNVQAQAGLSFFLPPTWEYRLPK
jgi:outer membrane beta-barrel protein